VPTPDRVGFGPRFICALSLGSLLNPINSSIIAIALVPIGVAFHAGAAATAWLISGLYLATAVAQPAMGKLADQWGARNVYLAGFLVVAAGGVLGALAPSLAALVVARVVIGVGTSAAFPAAVAIVRRQSERLSQEPPGSVLGMLATTSYVSLAIGPTIGGVLTAVGGWRWAFVVNLPVAIAGLALALLWLPHDRPRAASVGEAWRAVDAAGVVLFSGALIGLLLALNEPRHPDWLLMGGMLALGTVFLIWERRSGAPFIDVRMLAGNSGLRGTYARTMIAFLVIYSFIFGWTQWLEQGRGLSPSLTGFLMTPAFVIATVISLASARRRDVFWPLAVAAAGLCMGSACLLVLNLASPLWALALVSCLFGVPIGLTTVGNQAAMYAQTLAEQTGVASGLLRTFGYLGAILSSSLAGFAFGPRATDAGLHLIGGTCLAASALMLGMTAASPSLRAARNSADPEERPSKETK